VSIGINFDSDWDNLTEAALKKKPQKMELRPWGYFNILLEECNYAVKRLVVYPGQRLSLQRHRWRDEHWYIAEGAAKVTRDSNCFMLYMGDDLNIAKGSWHRVENKHQMNLVIIEVQTGDCFEEDIERKEDDYGRVH